MSLLLVLQPGPVARTVASTINATLSSPVGAVLAETGESYAECVLRSVPVGYWRLNEASGSVAIDSSGNGNHGTYTDIVTRGIVGATSGDAAVSVTRTTGRIAIPDMGYLPMTLEAWHKRDDTVADATYRDIASHSSNYHHLISLAGTRLFAIWNGTSYGFLYAEPNDGLWHHYVVVYQTVILQHLYVDGVLISSVNSGLDPRVRPIRRLGAWNSSYQVGPLDEVAIYPRALTAAEIAEHYALRYGAFNGQSAQFNAPNAASLITTTPTALLYQEQQGD